MNVHFVLEDSLKRIDVIGMSNQHFCACEESEDRGDMCKLDKVEPFGKTSALFTKK